MEGDSVKMPVQKKWSAKIKTTDPASLRVKNKMTIRLHTWYLITLRFFASSLRNSAVKKGLTAENRWVFTQRAANKYKYGRNIFANLHSGCICRTRQGFGTFSYAQSQIRQVYQYILNQEKHHLHKTFKEEYLEFLHKFEIEYEEKYLFDWNED